MGTRADFYIGQIKLQYLGSIAYDGYPERKKNGNENGISLKLQESKSIKEFTTIFKKEIETRDDFTSAKDGWPWPWEDSSTTDFTYVFNPYIKKVIVHNFSDKRKWPNMKSVQKIQFSSKKSGLLIFQQ